MNDRIFVISGTNEEYSRFIRIKCEELYRANNTSISLSNFVFVSSVDKLRGYRDPHGYFIGTWRSRRDIEEILYVIQTAITTSNFALDKVFLEYNKWKREKNLTT
jgi:hypothetical protein